MSKRSRITPKRNPEGSEPFGDEIVTVSLPTDLLERIDDRASTYEITRAEAIRRLVEIGLKAK